MLRISLENEKLETIRKFLFDKKNYILRAQKAVCLTGEKEAKGNNLFKIPKIIDNPRIRVENNQIVEIGQSSFHFDFPTEIVDLGDCLIVPPFVNAHTHLQLSWLKDQLLFKKGFVPWLKSLVPKLIAFRSHPHFREILSNSLKEAFSSLLNSGAGFVGDIGGSFPGVPVIINHMGMQTGIIIRHFAEAFGFKNQNNYIWPQACQTDYTDMAIYGNASPSGHALYSTSPACLKKIKAWCDKNKKCFSIHLAESPEETEMLLYGKGELREYYNGLVIKDDWVQPAMSPVKFAEKSELLNSRTLAVHCVQVDDNDIAMLASSGCNVCLCPRSNENLDVGQAPVKKMLDAGINLCLGTDGLSSNNDLDIRREAKYLINKFDIEPFAVLRMLTVNGAVSIGLKPEDATLYPGSKAVFAILPENFYNLPG